jgi:uncharacterized protein (TIGR03067 family)
MRLHAICAALAILPCALAADEGKKVTTDGDWEVVSVVANGEERPASAEKTVVTLKEGKFAVTQGGKAVRKGTYKENPKAKPMALDITQGDGPNKGKEAPAIYEVKGDTYRICLAAPGQPRGWAFESKEGSGHMLITYKRVKK